MARQTATSEAPVRERRREPAWLETLRAQASERFELMQWPSKSIEEWRRTDLAPYDPAAFVDQTAEEPEADPGAGGVTEAREGVAGVARFRGSRRLELETSERASSSGVKLQSLPEALGTAGGALEGLFLRGLEESDDRFRVWHYRSWTHGVLLHVPKGVAVDEPILVELAPSAAGGPCIPHLVIVLDELSSATVIVSYAGASAARSLLNAVTDVRVGEGATLRYTEVQNLPADSLAFLHTGAEIAAGGKLHHLAAAMGGRLHKSRLVCSLEGRGADASLNGLYFADGEQHADILTLQRHVSPGAASRTLYKGAAKDEAKTVFQGLIDVAVGASKTDAYLANKNLLLSGSARADSIPSLTIRNNDLRCSHGSTTSRIDPEQRFYLMARGLPAEEADEMLVEGYFEELIADAPGSEALRELVRGKTRGRG